MRLSWREEREPTASCSWLLFACLLLMEACEEGRIDGFFSLFCCELPPKLGCSMWMAAGRTPGAISDEELPET